MLTVLCSFFAGLLASFLVVLPVTRAFVRYRLLAWFLAEEKVYPLDQFNGWTFKNFITAGEPTLEGIIKTDMAANVLARLKIESNPIAPWDNIVPVDASNFIIAPKSPLAQVYPSGRKPQAPELLPSYSSVTGILVAWPVNYPSRWSAHAKLIAAIAEKTTAIVTIPNKQSADLLLAWLQKYKMASGQIRFLIARSDDIWMRDYGPTNIMTADGPAIIANPYAPYEHAFQIADNDIPYHVAQTLGLPVYRLPLLIEGGNIVHNGRGVAFICDSIDERNPSLCSNAINDILCAYFGFRSVVRLPSLPGEVTGHADMAVRFGDGCAWVSQLPVKHRWAATLDIIADIVAEYCSVIRIPAAKAPSHAFWSYANCLSVNGRIIAPGYNENEDAIAAAAFAKGGLNDVVFVDFRAFPLGSVHCQTKEWFTPLDENPIPVGAVA